MKSFFVCILLSISLGLGVVQAATDAPYFAGTTLSISGIDYAWVSATETGGDHVDTYVHYDQSGQNIDDTLIVGGLSGHPSLASVNSSGGGVYNWSGYLQNSTFVNSKRTVPAASNPPSFFDGNQNVTYVWSTGHTVFNIDLANDQVSVTANIDTYVGNGGGSFLVNMDGANNGSITGSENGTVTNGQWDVSTSGSTTSAQSGVSSFTFLGHVYVFTTGTYSVRYDNAGIPVYASYTDSYSSNTGGSASRTYNSSPSGVIIQWSGSDPTYGSWSADGNGNQTTSRSGPYNANPWSYSGANSVTYSWSSGYTAYVSDGAGGPPLPLSNTDTYTGSNGSSFTVTYESPGNGAITGNEYGYVVNGVWYMNANTGPSGSNPQSFYDSNQNVTYAWSSGSTTYSMDWANSQISVVARTDTYTGNNGGSFLVSLDASNNGSISGSENGSVISGQWNINNSGTTSSPQSGVSNFTFLGHTYSFSSGTYSFNYGNSGMTSASYTDSYSDNAGGWASATSNNNSAYGSSIQWTGWDPAFGSWSADGSGNQTISRSAPYNGNPSSYAGANLVTYSWSSGYASRNFGAGSGSLGILTVTDTYTGWNGGSFTVTYDTPGNAVISGSENGYVVNGVWYMNTRLAPAASNPASFRDNNQNVTYTWSSGSTSYNVNSASSSVTVTGYVDTYTGTNGGSFVVTLDANFNGAISGSESGTVANGQWVINSSGTSLSPQSGLSSFSILGATYTFTSGTYSVRYDNAGNATEASYTDSYSGNSGGSASRSYTSNGPAISAQWSGWDPAYGSWSADGNGNQIFSRSTPFPGNPWSYSGYTSSGNSTYYYWSSGAYSWDYTSGQARLISTDTYSGPLGTFWVTYDQNGYGTISGSESGYVINGTWYLNNTYTNSTPGSGMGNFSLFGAYYTFQSTSGSYGYNSAGGYIWYATDTYTSNYGGWLTISLGGSGSPSGTFTGNDPEYGSFSGTYNSGSLTITADVAPRTAPSFAPRQLWVSTTPMNTTLVNWQSGSVDSSGNLTDSYTGYSPDQGTISLSVSGNPRASGTVNAYVTNSITSGYGSYFNGVFTMSIPWDVRTSDPTRSSPQFAASSLWVNGTEYPFTVGYDDAYGNGTDTYVNPVAGTLTISGTGNTNLSVFASQNGAAYYGTLNAYGNAGFAVPGLSIQTAPPAHGPPAFWVNGVFYLRVSEYENTYNGSGGLTLSISGSDPANISLSGSESNGWSFSGIYNTNVAGLFLLASNSGSARPAFAANADGSLLLSNQAAPAEYPPAISIGGYGSLQYLGTALDTDGSGNQAAFYGNAASGGPGNFLLKIRADGTVIVSDLASNSSTSGTYNFQKHLFQTIPGQLPMPIYGVDPQANNILWGLTPPPSGRPPTILVGTDVWRYTGTDGNGDVVYEGYYSGQQISLGATETDGSVGVALTDPFHPNSSGATNFTGIFYNGNFRMRDGSPNVFSGDDSGARILSQFGQDSLRSITGDLDILGNFLSLGALTDAPNTAGLTLNFTDNGTTASLTSALGRPSAEWIWSRSDANSPGTAIPMMKLGTGNRLSLYNPANPAAEWIVLDPAGGSLINGPLRIPEAGDLSMGSFTNGPRPDGQ